MGWTLLQDTGGCVCVWWGGGEAGGADLVLSFVMHGLDQGWLVLSHMTWS
jgi:hypothetical protein